MDSNNDIDTLSKQIVALLVDMNKARKEKAQLQIRLEELNLELTKVKKQYQMAEDQIRSAKHQITEFCVEPTLKAVK